MSRALLIKTPFASASQTAKTLGVSKSRKQQLVKMLEIAPFDVKKFKKFLKKHKKSRHKLNYEPFRLDKPAKKSVKRRPSKRSHASTKTRSSGGNSSR